MISSIFKTINTDVHNTSGSHVSSILFSNKKIEYVRKLLFILQISLSYPSKAGSQVRPMIPEELRGSGNAGILLIDGISRASRHPSGDMITCKKSEKAKDADQMRKEVIMRSVLILKHARVSTRKKKQSLRLVSQTVKKIAKTSSGPDNFREALKNFASILKKRKKPYKRIGEDLDSWLDSNSLNKNDCYRIDTSWPSLEASKSVPTIVNKKSDEARLDYLINNIGQYNSVKIHFDVGYVRPKIAFGLELQQEVITLVSNEIRQFGLDSVFLENQRQVNLFGAQSWKIGDQLSIGYKAGMSSLGYFTQSSPLLDVSAIRALRNFNKLEQGSRPILDGALLYHWGADLGLRIENLIGSHYRSGFFNGKIIQKRQTLVDLAIADEIYRDGKLGAQATLEVWDIANAKQESYLKKIHAGLLTRFDGLAFDAGLNQGNMSVGLGIDQADHRLSLGSTAYEFGDRIGFRRDPRYFLNYKSRF